MAQPASKSSDGTLLGLLLATLYSVFTLLPSSHSAMVSWPWVFVWQITLGLPILWVLWQLWFKPLRQFRLGGGFDFALLGIVGVLILSTLLADFPQQALWNTWAALGFIAAIYALSGWITTSHRLLKLLQFQAVLGIIFILVSLSLWIFQTYLPELTRLENLQQFGVYETFNFSQISLRNWYPIGHQNYVAGYLLLILPLLGGFTLVGPSRWRWLNLGGALLGIVDLYTTSSRGGLLALLFMMATAGGIALWHSSIAKTYILLLGTLTIGGLSGIVLLNGRTRNFLAAISRGDFASGELAYRWITNMTGWHMGWDHPWVGAGPGSVPLLYQRYRPYWAGREAELHFQLHSTPAQLWAELGGLGLFSVLLLILLVVRATGRWALASPGARAAAPSNAVKIPNILVWSLVVGLLGYGVISLSDYQLDNICISGVLVIYGVALGKTLVPAAAGTASAAPTKPQRWVTMASFGLVLAVTVWLMPIHRAWAASSTAFRALQADDLSTFQAQLELAHTLAPWESYYPYQLGWQLGDMSFQGAGELRNDGINWLVEGNQVSPYREFGQANLGWLSISVNPEQAQAAFAKAAQLVPAKPGAFLGLGYSLLRSENAEPAVEALTLEVLRHPSMISSRIWQFPQFAPLYDTVLQQSIDRCSELLSQPGFPLSDYVQGLRGGLYWWQGNQAAAAADWQQANSTLGSALIALSQETISSEDLGGLGIVIPAQLAIRAWLEPDRRRTLLTQALTMTPADMSGLDGATIAERLEQLIASMAAADSFEDWLKRTAPVVEPRNQRSGFGVLSRHIDGIHPKDYQPRIENLAVQQFFAEVFPSPRYLPQWDTVLQPMREQLIESLSA